MDWPFLMKNSATSIKPWANSTKPFSSLNSELNLVKSYTRPIKILNNSKMDWPFLMKNSATSIKPMGQFDKALQFFEQQNLLAKELYEANARNMDLFFGLGVSFYKLGQINLALNKKQKALSS